jgi:hypothetical protein
VPAIPFSILCEAVTSNCLSEENLSSLRQGPSCSASQYSVDPVIYIFNYRRSQLEIEISIVLLERPLNCSNPTVWKAPADGFNMPKTLGPRPTVPPNSVAIFLA